MIKLGSANVLIRRFEIPAVTGLMKNQVGEFLRAVEWRWLSLLT